MYSLFTTNPLTLPSLYLNLMDIWIFFLSILPRIFQTYLTLELFYTKLPVWTMSNFYSKELKFCEHTLRKLLDFHLIHWRLRKKEKGWGRENSLSQSSSWGIDLLPLNLDLDLDWNLHQVLLGFQLADLRSWDFSASILWRNLL